MGHERATGDDTGTAPDERDRAAMRRDGCYLIDTGGRRFLDLGPPGAEDPMAGDPVADRARLAGYGERLRTAFASECADQDVRGALTGSPLALSIEFAGQENASPELMGSAFLGELRAANLLGGPVLHMHPMMDDAAADFAENSLRQSVRRIRTLLVEHNSWLSGGLRYPFPPSAQGVAERGLAIYRFPKTGNVDVTAVDDRIRIEFAPGDVGAITSSGFYIPTLIAGDFVFEAQYEIDTWHPDPVEPACFALFVQNEASSYRYYAQRMSAGDDDHELVAGTITVEENHLSDPVPVKDRRSAFRLTRQGQKITFQHREGWDEETPWSTLGTALAPPEQEVILGAKIWTKLRCQGLSVEICNLWIEGRMADRQVPPVPVVEDPRSNSPSCP